MEATGDHDFNARNKHELSFKKGSILKILTSKGDNKEWLRWPRRAGANQLRHIETQRVRDLKTICDVYYLWYHGKISRLDAERLLNDQKQDGAFLVRESESNPGDFSVSVKFAQGVEHFKILRNSTGKYYLYLTKFSSLNQLVEFHRTPSATQQLLLKDPVPNKQLTRFLALWDFQPKEEGMLLFKKNDVITLIDKTTHPDWLKGIKDGVQGIFPRSYVRETK